MKTIKAKKNQTVFDIAVEQYGTCEAVGEIIANNPGLVNDPAALAVLGVNALDDDGFYFDAALLAGLEIMIDTNSDLMRKTVTKEITQPVTTFNL